MAWHINIGQPLSSGFEYCCCILYITKDYSKEYRITYPASSTPLEGVFTYIVLGILIVKTLVDVPILSDFLQRYVNKILGIVLILVGMVLLDLLRIPLPIPSVSENVAKKLAEKGTFGSLPLGILFALAFCPVSAALFFGGLIPIAVKAQSGIGLPLIYGIGTGLPVLLFAFLVAAGTGYINNLYHRITRIEFYTKKGNGHYFYIGRCLLCLGVHF